MKLLKRCLVFVLLFLVPRRARSLIRAIFRQLLQLLLHGWPKFILVASKADADACASPMAFLLAHKLTVDQVWWRMVRAGKEHTPRGLEHYIPMIHFDTARKFDGEMVDGKLVKPGSRYFDHHQPDPNMLNHCATSLVVESFGLKEPVLNFLGEYVRLIDTGHTGEANALLNNSRGGNVFIPIIVLHRFFEVFGKAEMNDVISRVAYAIFDLRKLFTNLNKAAQYSEELRQLDLCEKLYKAVKSFDWEYIKRNFAEAKQAGEKVVAKLCDPDASTDAALYLAVYGIEQSNAQILRAMSPLVNGLKKSISYADQLKFGCEAFQSFYNQETWRQKLLRDLLPGGAINRMYIKHPSAGLVRLVIAPDSLYDGTILRVVTRQAFHDSVDLIICGSPDGRMGLILVDPEQRDVLSLSRFREVLVVRYPAQKTSFLHPSEFLLYLNKDIKDKDKISFDELMALVKECIETPPAEVTPAVVPNAPIATAVQVATAQC